MKKSNRNMKNVIINHIIDNILLGAYPPLVMKPDHTKNEKIKLEEVNTFLGAILPLTPWKKFRRFCGLKPYKIKKL